MRRPVLLGVVLLLALAGCVAFGAASDPQPVDAAPDGGGSTSDGSSGASASPDGGSGAEGDAAGAEVARPPPGVVNLMPGSDGSFEAGSCGSNASVNSSDSHTEELARTGSGACQVCRDPGNNGNYALDTIDLAVPTPGEVYHAEAWVRLDPVVTGPQRIDLAVRTSSRSGGEVEVAFSTPVQASSEWARVAVTLPVTRQADKLDAQIRALSNESGERCFIADDIVVWRD